MTVAISHIRILVHARTRTDNTANVSIAEINFYDAAGSAISKTGMVASASSDNGGSDPAANAIDGSITGTSRWLSNSVAQVDLTATPEWLAVDLNGGKSVRYIELCALSSSGDGGAGWGPGTFDIQGSYNGTIWTTLFSTTTEKAWKNQEWRRFYIPRPTPTVAWNGADADSGITVFASDLHAANNSGTTKGLIRANTVISAAVKTYFEVRVRCSGTFPGGGVYAVGLANASALLTANLGANANGWGYWNTGDKKHNASSVAAGPTYTLDDTLMVARDGANVWFGKNGAWIEGSPAGGVGASYTNLSGDLYPALSPWANTTEGLGMFMDDQFRYPPPAGFVGLEAGAPAVVPRTAISVSITDEAFDLTNSIVDIVRKDQELLARIDPVPNVFFIHEMDYQAGYDEVFLWLRENYTRYWQPGVTLNVGDHIIPKTYTGLAHIHKVTTGGVTGSVEPTWRSDAGTVVGDGDVAYEWVKPAINPIVKGPVLLTRSYAEYGSEWEANNAAYVIDDSIRNTDNGHWYQILPAYNSGGPFTSGATPPTWPTDGGNVVDNQITWTDMGAMV